MASEKFDAANALIAAARHLREVVQKRGEHIESGGSTDNVVRNALQAHLEMVRAACALRDAPADPEVEKAAGKLLLERIDRSVEVKSREEWEACAAAAIDVAEQHGPEAEKMFKAWTDAADPVRDLGFELMARADQRGHEAMMEGARQAAEQTPGASFRATEIIGDQVVSDETIYGPAPGEEDAAETTTDRLSLSAQRILGLDDEQLNTDIERLRVLHSQLLVQRHGLDSSASLEDVRLTVAEKLRRLTQQDLWITDVTGDLSMPITPLGTQDFPAFRAQLLLNRMLVITEGSVHSRFTQGDRSAATQMVEFVFLAEMTATAKAYFLPTAQIGQKGSQNVQDQLPAQSTFFVCHDTALPIGGDFHAIAWLFATDENGRLYDAAQVIRLDDDDAIEMSWCSLSEGEAAPTAQAVVETLSAGDWEKPKTLRLPGEAGSKEWKRALVRSAARAKNGALRR